MALVQLYTVGAALLLVGGVIRGWLAWRHRDEPAWSEMATGLVIMGCVFVCSSLVIG